MFDLPVSLQPFDGQTFATYKELRVKLEEIRLKHLADLPPDFGAHEMFFLGRDKGWIKESEEGILSVDLSAPTDSCDYKQLDPGIRETVRLLRRHGFNTTDSGDGSKADEMECATGFPMVAISVEPERLVSEASRLFRILSMGHDIRITPQGLNDGDPAIQATFDPADQVAVIILVGVKDSMIRKDL